MSLNMRGPWLGMTCSFPPCLNLCLCWCLSDSEMDMDVAQMVMVVLEGTVNVNVNVRVTVTVCWYDSDSFDLQRKPILVFGFGVGAHVEEEAQTLLISGQQWISFRGRDRAWLCWAKFKWMGVLGNDSIRDLFTMNEATLFQYFVSVGCKGKGSTRLFAVS